MKTPEHARPWWLLPVGRIHPLWWSGIGAGLIWIDYAVGPLAQFPVLYVIPVSLAAWYSGKLPALALATAVPLVHIMFLMTVWAVPGQPIGVVPTVFRGAVIVIMALWFARLSEHERSLHRYVLRLEGLLPICSFCKSIRNEAGNWEPLEGFISTRSTAQFSHGFCEDCLQRQYLNRKR